ncbi:MAG: V-type ATP synthase subunit E family protein [Gemmiger sp.]
MNELDTRAERFLESIRAEGEAACAAIRTETDAEIDRQLDEARQAQQAKAEHTLHFETERARTRANRELSAARMQARAKLAAQRQQIAADTFAAARTQLAAFAAGKDYAAGWSKCYRLPRPWAKRHCTPTADLPLLQGAARRCGPDAMTPSLAPARCQPATGLAADDTLEARLDAQHDWFLQNAGLEITI